MNDEQLLALAKQYGLQYMRPEQLQTWFEMIKYFKARYEPASNVILWYRAGLKYDLEKLLGKIPDYSNKDNEQAKIDNLSTLMGTLNSLDQ